MRRSILLTAILLLMPGREISRLQEALQPTSHPEVPARLADLWLVPAAGDAEARTVSQHRPLIAGVDRYQAGEYTEALPLVSHSSLAGSPLSDYAAYYYGLAQLRLSRGVDARAILDALVQRQPVGHLSIAAPLAAAEAAEVAGDPAAAVRIYERLAADKIAVNEDVLSRLGRAALAAGDRKKAADAFRRVYYEFPLSDVATTAGSHLTTLSDTVGRSDQKRDLARAQQLFAARRYAEASAAFKELQPRLSGDDKELADLRIAESDFFLKRYAAARDALRPYLDRASRKAEARFFYLSALRDLGDEEQFVTLARALVDEFPGSSWAEEALNSLARHYVLANDDAQAAALYAELFEKFPKGPQAERAAWRAGWWQYKLGNYADTVRIFERASATFPRSDYRPSYLYWSARAYEKLNEPSQARARFRLTYTDYANSYYGRLAERALGLRPGVSRAEEILPVSHQPPPARSPLPNEERIRLLLANGLYDDALNELRYARRAWGNTPALEATMAWAYHRKGELRTAITLMRRAYPQFLTAGHRVPPEILQVIFPLTYWDAIRRYSTERGLDPYLIAALVAQESTFDPEARSIANAYGMMQIVPATGRSLARTLGIRRFTTSMLTNAETNLRLGTLYFSQLSRQFGGAHFALAAYNAGVNRVVRWKAERPGIDREEFIDDIPFPETQNYVKRILGTAEDYRRLYGEGLIRPQPIVAANGNPAAVLPQADIKKAPAPKPATKKPTARKPAAKSTTKKPPIRKR